jgi:hypothetical protein
MQVSRHTRFRRLSVATVNCGLYEGDVKNPNLLRPVVEGRLKPASAGG